jgi:transposase-like protein
MEKLPRQVYTSEFRRQAAEMVAREGLSIAGASRRHSLSTKTLTNWVRRAKGGGSPETAAPVPAARSRSRRPSCRGCGARMPNCGWSATS